MGLVLETRAPNPRGPVGELDEEPVGWALGRGAEELQRGPGDPAEHSWCHRATDPGGQWHRAHLEGGGDRFRCRDDTVGAGAVGSATRPHDRSAHVAFGDTADGARVGRRDRGVDHDTAIRTRGVGVGVATGRGEQGREEREQSDEGEERDAHGNTLSLMSPSGRLREEDSPESMIAPRSVTISYATKQLST